MHGGSMGTGIIPDFEWYAGESTKRGTATPRCPFGSAERCPRYHHSLAMLRNAGFAQTDVHDDARLDQRWRQLGLMPKIAGQATGVTSSEDQFGERKTHGYSNFCPEVSYDSFGYFASSLYRYADEIDSDCAHARLGKMSVPRSDWRWAWASVRAMHYSECPLYSILSAHSAAAVGDDSAADVTLKVPGIADLRFKWRAKETWKAIKEWMRHKTARSPKHIQAER
jgi:hypothetical protein